MIRLHFVVEGQTEEVFVRDVLMETLAAYGVIADVHRITTGRRGGAVHRGGFVSYAHLKRDLSLWMKQDSNADSWFTTMVDFYGLPADFPGTHEARSITDPIERMIFLERQLSHDLKYRRFVPYIQLHEFEALLFSDAKSFATAFPDANEAIGALQRIRDSAASPEHIDDGEKTAPSKRICAILPDYVKPVAGPLIARAIGLSRIRGECKHFNAWIEMLLGLGS